MSHDERPLEEEVVEKADAMKQVIEQKYAAMRRHREEKMRR